MGTLRPSSAAGIMANISSVVIRRFTASARAVSQITISNAKPVSAVGSDNLEICQSFRKLAISPEEVRLSAAFQKNASPISGLGIDEYKLPSLIRPLSITVPSLYNGKILDQILPPTLNVDDKIDPSENAQIREAPSGQVIEKQAARLIVIRRRMMKKHKLKKLRKKMKFDWLKIIQRREYKKEKEFQATQMARVREAEAFDAEAYVADFLRQTKEKPIPKFYKGKRLPKEIIYDLQEKDRQKRLKVEQANKERNMRWQDI